MRRFSPQPAQESLTKPRYMWGVLWSLWRVIWFPRQLDSRIFSVTLGHLRPLLQTSSVSDRPSYTTKTQHPFNDLSCFVPRLLSKREGSPEKPRHGSPRNGSIVVPLGFVPVSSDGASCWSGCGRCVLHHPVDASLNSASRDRAWLFSGVYFTF